MPESRLILTCSILLTSAPVLHADHGPGTSGGGMNTQSAEILKPGQWSFSLQNDWTDFKSVPSESAEELDFISSISLTTLTVSAGILENLQAALAYGYYAGSGAGEFEDDGERVTFDPDGFTDLWLTAKWRLYRGPAGQFAVFGGVKAPVGETDILTSEGERAEPPSMPGSGAWDGLIGGAYTYAFNPSLTLDASAQYTIRGTHFGYQIGNRLDAGAALSWRICGDAESFPQVSLTAEALLRSMEKSESSGTDLTNTGGRAFLLAPGFRIGFSRNAALSVSAQLPVVQSLNGDQVESRFRISSCLTLTF